MTKRRLAIVAFAAMLLASETVAAKTVANTVLIVTYTTGYRHGSIEQAANAIAQLARDAGMTVEVTGDPERFDRPLNTVRTIALVSTTTRRNQPETEWLTGSRRKAFKKFMRRGGGVLAIHGAADSHYAWDWYGRMIGARFARHPKGTPTGTLRRAKVAHPSLTELPSQFSHTDEWYWFANVDPALRHLLTLSPGSIGETGSEDHPVTWAHAFGGGRVFYSSLGHTPEAWRDRLVLAHVRGGLLWASKHRP